MDRNLTSARFDARTSRTFNRILDTLGLRTKKTLDMGCGQGEHLIHFGEGSIGVTTKGAEVAFGRTHGVNIIEGNVEIIDELPGLHEAGFEALWANNLFEHVLSPHAFLIRLKALAGTRDDVKLILGVPVIPKIVSLMKIRKFRGALSVAHVNFFTHEALRLFVERAGWKIEYVRPFVFSNRLLDLLFRPLAPHLYVVAHNDPDFRYAQKKLDEWVTDPLYEHIFQVVPPLPRTGASSDEETE